MSTRRLRLRSSDLEWRLIEGEIVVLDLGRAEYLVVNDTGAVLWPMLVEGATREELIASIVATHDVDVAAAAADVDAFVDSLATQALLES